MDDDQLHEGAGDTIRPHTDESDPDLRVRDFREWFYHHFPPGRHVTRTRSIGRMDGTEMSDSEKRLAQRYGLMISREHKDCI